MAREVSPGFFWIQECGPNRESFAQNWGEGGSDWHQSGREIHVPQNIYLLAGQKKTLLFDTLSPASGNQVVEEAKAILGDRPLDYLVISHPDVPHAGNAGKIMRAYPNARLVAPAQGETHELYHLEKSLKVGPGDELDLGGFRVQFHEATFLDAAMSIWMSEVENKIFFPVDWLGFPHMDGECLCCVDEIDSEITVSRLTEFHGRVMFWFQYVDVEKVNADVERLIERFGTYTIAPSHGLLIRVDAAQYMERLKEVTHYVSEQGRLGVL